MPGRDYYQILGVDRGADKKAIKSAYRKLARKCHPDVNPNDKRAETRFKEISEAYHVLGDAEKRKLYDQFGDNWSRVGAGAGAGQPGGGFTANAGGPEEFSYDFGGGDFSDVFETLFGQSRRAGRTRATLNKGQDIEHEIAVTLDEALSGTTKRVQLSLREPCQSCHGVGGRTQTCGACGGSGMQKQGGGIFNLGSPCPRCHGQGETLSDTCGACHGSGSVDSTRKLDVNVPAGVKDGSRIRVGGQGGSGAGNGASGDLYLRVRVEKDAFFERRGDDLHCELPISFPEAALGAEVQVPTKKGRVNMKIPAGTQSGQTLRLSGLGAPHLRGNGHGDQYVKIKIVVPNDLTEEERFLIKEMASKRTENPRSHLKV